MKDSSVVITIGDKDYTFNVGDEISGYVKGIDEMIRGKIESIYSTDIKLIGSSESYHITDFIEIL